MPWQDPPLPYRDPVTLAVDIVRGLGGSWAELSPASQAETQDLLAQVRSLLRQAGGDSASDRASAVYNAGRRRTVALGRFLYACETSPALPDSFRTKLAAGHGPVLRGGSSASAVSKAQARTIVGEIDLVVGPAPAASIAPPSAEVFTDPLGRTRKLLTWLAGRQESISIEVEDFVTAALVRLGLALERSASTAEAEAAALGFLREVKAFPAAYEALTDTTVFRSHLGAGAGSGTPAADILATLRQDAVVGPRLAEAHAVQASPPTGAEPSTGPGQPTGGAVVPKGIDLQPTDVPLHTFVDFPAEVSVFDRKIPLTVQFTIEKRAGSRVADKVTLAFARPEQPELVQVVCNAEGFKEETGVATRVIEVYSSRDSQPAIFLLTPQDGVKAGTKRISLDFYHAGVLALSSSFDVELKDRPPLNREPVAGIRPLISATGEHARYSVTASLVLVEPIVAIPDLVLRVAMSADERELRYTLDSPSGRFGFRHAPLGSVRLPERRSPREFLQSTYDSLDEMAGSSIENRPADETEANRKAIDEIGWNLYEQLFSPELKDAWRAVQAARAGKTDASLLILSDEPWLPWEMVHPTSKDAAGNFVAEGFLCEQFRLSRWVAGRRMPEAIALTSALLVAPKSNLESVKREKAYFAQLAQTHPTVAVGERALERADEVKDAMAAQKARLYHFACHGTFEAEDPDDSSLVLVGKPLRPSEIIGPTQVGIERSKPLVFLNACTSSAADMRLIGVGGWSKRFVDAGVTAFVGSLWEVNDLLAAEFAQAFYNRLIVDKQPLGEAFHQARQVIKQMDPGNPTWLAYVLYAHPNGTVVIGA